MIIYLPILLYYQPAYLYVYLSTNHLKTGEDMLSENKRTELKYFLWRKINRQQDTNIGT